MLRAPSDGPPGAPTTLHVPLPPSSYPPPPRPLLPTPPQSVPGLPLGTDKEQHPGNPVINPAIKCKLHPPAPHGEPSACGFQPVHQNPEYLELL